MVNNKILAAYEKEHPEFPKYILEELERELGAKVKDSEVSLVLEKVVEEYGRSLISPYEAIGVITAQSVGERSTQMTLNTFHFAGVAEQSVEGLPRLIEILDAKKNLSNPTMRLYMASEKNLSDEKVKIFANKIKETKLVEFATNVEIDMEEKIVKIDFDLKNLKRYDLDLESFVPLLDKKIRKSGSVDGKSLLVKGTATASMKDLIGIKELAMNTIVYGIKGVSDVSIIKEGEDYVILTQGISLKNVQNLDFIDKERVYCNDVHEMADFYGVEVARQTIIREIMEVVKSQGLSINERHVLLIADAMTYTGSVRGMTRYGIVAEKLNVLTRASFETPLKHLSKGSVINEHNILNSITENVMTNQMVYVGTGIPKVAVKARDK